MKKTLIFAISLAFFNCSPDDSNLNDITLNEQQTFKDYNDISSFVSDLEELSEQSSTQVKNASKNGNGDCFTLELFIPNTETPIPGFEEFDYYSKMTIDQTVNDCIFKDWSGKLEYYVANKANDSTLFAKWKDSTVYKNVQYKDGRIYNGYRVTEYIPEYSGGGHMAFEVRINGIIEGLTGDIYSYVSERNLKYRNRYSPYEILNLNIQSTLSNTTQQYTIYENTLSNKSLFFKASCFEGPSYLKYPVSGSQDFSTNFGIKFNIDYGDETCDKLAILTPFGGDPIEIEL